MKAKKLPVVIPALVLSFTVVLFFVLMFMSFRDSLPTSVISPIDLTYIKPTPTPTPDPLAPKNVLILGYGGGKHEGGELTDTIIVSQIRPKEKRAVLLTIPRDLWVSIPISPEASASYKINEAYVIGRNDKQYPNKLDVYKAPDGGKRLAKDTVEKVTGLPIDYTVVLSFQGFLDAIKPFEPLTVTVPRAFTDPYYPIEGKETDPCGKSEDDIRELTATMSGFELEKEFPCRYETLSFAKGKTTMDAATALKFVRSRHADGDFGRSERQAAVIVAVRNKILSVSSIPKLVSLGQTLLQSVDTTINAGAIPRLLNLYQDYGSYEVTTISLTEDNVLKSSIGPQKQYILIPKAGEENWKSIHDFIQTSITATQSAVPTQ